MEQTDSPVESDSDKDSRDGSKHSLSDLKEEESDEGKLGKGSSRKDLKDKPSSRDVRVRTFNLSQIALQNISEVPEESEDELGFMVEAFSIKGLQHLVDMKQTLEDLKESTYSDLAHIALKKSRVTNLMNSIQMVVAEVGDYITSMPRFKFERDSVKLEMRWQPTHTCRFCSCHTHPKPGEEITMETRETARALGQTLGHCQKYCDMLDSVRGRYTAIMKQLDSAFMMLTSGLESLQWDQGYEGYVADYSALHPRASTLLNMRLASVEFMPNGSTKEKMEKACSIKDFVARLTMGVVRVLCDVNTRLADMKNQNQLLDYIMDELGIAEELVSKASVEVRAKLLFML
jgi:hypothetical protein